jgi:transposase InsO family protein
MPWLEVNRIMLRSAFVSRALMGERMVSVCREFGISRKTGYKWLSRWRKEGIAGLQDRSRRPLSHPRQTSSAVVGLIKELRFQHPAWGPLKIKARLEADGYPMPSARSIANVLQRCGLVEQPAASQPARERFERPEPNELWQLDTKGWFILKGVGRVYPVAILDDHSRFLLALRACRRENFQWLKGTLDLALAAYGCPEALLTDRHTVFSQPGGLTAWECRLIALGIKTIHGRVGRPTTQGKVERFHQTLQKEVISRYRFADLADCQQAFDEWRQTYNTYRPHQALEGEMPASRYRPSERPLPDPFPTPQYPPEAIVRWVTRAGLIKFAGRQRFISRGLAGWQVAVLPCDKNQWPVLFFDRVVGRIPAP